MKIAFIIRMFQAKNFHGGGEKLFYNLINRFADDGHLVDIYCSSSDVESAKNINKIKVVDVHYDHNRPQTMEFFYNQVKILIKDENYDAVISENITPPVDMVFLQGHSLVNRLKKTKNPLEAFLYNFRKVKKDRIKYQKKWMEQGYRRIFVVSELLKQDIVENFGVAPEKIAVIYPGVETANPVTARSEAIHTFGLIAPGFKIKGGFVLLKALNILKKRGYKFKTKIIYPKFNKNLGVKILINLYNLADNVEFLPYQDNLAGFYGAIDCLVVPSIEDTFNIAALEAMAFGKPIIISNNAGACELVSNGENGFRFNIRQNGIKNLAHRLMFFLDNPELHAQLSCGAMETAMRYGWDRVYKETAALVQRDNFMDNG